MTRRSGAASPVGAILAGGHSRRMGTDKARVPVGGTPMIEWVDAALRAVVDEVVVVGREDSLAGIPAVPDLRPGPRGPLPGLVAALHHAAGRPVLLVAVDQPLVRPATLRGLLDLLDEDAVVPVDGGARQITCAAYPASWVEAADAEDRAGGSIQSLLERLPHREVGPKEWVTWDEDGRSWHSVDSPDAVAAVLDRWPERARPVAPTSMPTPVKSPAPALAVGAVVVEGHKLLLAKRAREPNRGCWAVPGGKVHWGETMESAVRREVEEETGLLVEVGDVVWVGDAMGPDPDPSYHYVLVDFRARVVGGSLRAADDAEDVAFVDLAEARKLQLTATMFDLLDVLDGD